MWLFMIASLLSFSSAQAGILKDEDVKSFKVELPDIYSAEAELSFSKRKVEQSELEFHTSSWAPENFTLDSRVAAATKFQTKNSLPHAAVAYVAAPWDETKIGKFNLRFGIAYSNLKRTAIFNSQAVSQSAYLVSGEVGVEYSPKFLHGRYVSIYFGESLFPSLASTERSVLDDGTSNFGLAFRSIAGIQFDLKKILPAILDLRFTRVFGKAGKGNLLGSGLGVALRFPI